MRTGRYRNGVGAVVLVLALLAVGTSAAAAGGPAGKPVRAALGWADDEAEVLLEALGLDDEDEGPWVQGTVSEGADLLPQAAIGVDAAVAAAQAVEADAVHGVELEREDGRLLFEIEIGDKEILIDANDGRVVSVETDD